MREYLWFSFDPCTLRVNLFSGTKYYALYLYMRMGAPMLSSFLFLSLAHVHILLINYSLSCSWFLLDSDVCAMSPSNPQRPFFFLVGWDHQQTMGYFGRHFVDPKNVHGDDSHSLSLDEKKQCVKSPRSVTFFLRYKSTKNHTFMFHQFFIRIPFSANLLTTSNKQSWSRSPSRSSQSPLSSPRSPLLPPVPRTPSRALTVSTLLYFSFTSLIFPFLFWNAFLNQTLFVHITRVYSQLTTVAARVATSASPAAP